MWLSNIKDWTRLSFYDLLDSTMDRTHWRKVVAVHLNDRHGPWHDDNDDHPVITARVFPPGIRDLHMRLFRGKFVFSIDNRKPIHNTIRRDCLYRLHMLIQNVMFAASFNKIATHATAQMAADKEAVCLPRVHIYIYSSCPYEIIVYPFLNINSCNQLSIYSAHLGPLGERIPSNYPTH